MLQHWLLWLALWQVARAACPNLCNGRGECTPYGTCKCQAGYQGGDCSEQICPFGPAWTDVPYATDKAHALAECSNRGLCDRATGLCSCMSGFVGSSCNRMDCPNRCGGVGQCYTMNEFASRTTNPSGNSFTYGSNWDASMVKGCVCDVKYGLYDCSKKLCPTGDDPLTTGQANQVQLLVCIANAGSFTLLFKGYPSAQIPSTATATQVRTALLAIPLLSDVKVTFSSGTTSVCALSRGVVQIEFIQNFGNNPPLKPVIDATMSAAAGNVLVYSDGVTTVLDRFGTKYVSVVGTKENAVCSNRGICSTDGTCSCFSSNGDSYASSDGYGKAGRRGDCGFISSGTTVGSCPGQVQCSGHGLCSKSTLTCSCQTGWEGGDCSLRSCPTGLSWFDYPTKNEIAHVSMAICSNAGICDYSSGVCTCGGNFVGRACDRLVCGGGSSAPCNGHGVCSPMIQAAQSAVNNVGNPITITYGANPNNYATWEATRMSVCLCDSGYAGYDCSLLTCPVGDDPMTTEDHVEVQLIKCSGTGGSFTLTFRGETTVAMNAATATASTVSRALMGLDNIVGRVDVWSTADIRNNNASIPVRTFDIVNPSKALPEGFPSWAYFNFSGSSPFGNVMNGPNGAVGFTGGGAGQLKLSQMNPGYDGRLDEIKNPPFLAPACMSDGSNVLIVKFSSTHGPLPPLKANTALLTTKPGSKASVLVYSGGATVAVGKVTLKSVKGSTETAVCSNQGLCDTTTGRCNCFPSFSSSDGAGGPGTRRDCGYQVPSLSSYADSNAVVFPWELSGKGQYPGPITGTDQEHRRMGPLDLRQYVPINGKKK